MNATRLGFELRSRHAPRCLSPAPDLAAVSARKLTVICDVRINGQRDTGRDIRELMFNRARSLHEARRERRGHPTGHRAWAPHVTQVDSRLKTLPPLLDL
jgi:hypothetical protein